MSRLEWNDELSMGIKDIDEQHKELIRIANDLLQSIARKEDSRSVQDVIHSLREYTVFHFNFEERLMADVNYPERIQHANTHANLKEQVKHFQRHLYLKNDVPPEAVLAFLKTWLLDHILTWDRAVARFIRKRDEQLRKLDSPAPEDKDRDATGREQAAKPDAGAEKTGKEQIGKEQIGQPDAGHEASGREGPQGSGQPAPGHSSPETEDDGPEDAGQEESGDESR